jgi:hypothetical protein
MFIKHNHRLQHVSGGIFFIIVLQFNIQFQVTIVPLFQTPTTKRTINHHLANAQTNHKKTKLNVLELWCLYQMYEWVRETKIRDWDGYICSRHNKQKKRWHDLACLRCKKEKRWWNDTCSRNDKWERVTTRKWWCG